MQSIATSVRITASANALLSSLASRTGKPKAQIVEDALREWEDRVFWKEVQDAFASNPGECKAETELWESTVGDGFQPRRRRRTKR